MDSRIGKKAFLQAGPGFGGSCFPKDLTEFIQAFKDQGLAHGILESALAINEQQKHRVVEKIEKLVPDLRGESIGILGLAFKANTDDIRYSPSLTLIEALIKKGAQIKVFDPHAMENCKKIYPDIIYTTSLYDCVAQTQCFVIMTEWGEFRQPDWDIIQKEVTQKNIVDMRNIYEPNEMRAMGFGYVSVGRV
jgi:UDPglucose 6-dehydrogenase